MPLTDFVPKTWSTVITCLCCTSTGNLLLLSGSGGSVLGLFLLVARGKLLLFSVTDSQCAKWCS